MHRKINTQQRLRYVAPQLEQLRLTAPQHLLVAFSADASFEEFESGEDLDTV